MVLLIFNLRFGWGSIHLHAPAALLPDKEHGYPLTKRFIGPQNQLGRFIKRNMSPVGIQTTISRLSVPYCSYHTD
jgi:hypothetical protein